MYNQTMKLIVGLGNPGDKYIHTRHNIGQTVLDVLIRKLDKREQKIIFCKPKNYMNNSGEEINKLAHYYKISSENIWVLQDDVDLDFGIVRFRSGGSSGGHNGIKSIIEHLKTENFKRIKIGIGRDPKIDTADYVLDNFSKAQKEKLPQMIDKITDMVLNLLEEGFKEETVNFDS